MLRSRKIHLVADQQSDVIKTATQQGFLCVPAASLRCNRIGVERLNAPKRRGRRSQENLPQRKRGTRMLPTPPIKKLRQTNPH